MTENWDSYDCTVDGKPAAIMVDLGVCASAPAPEYPYMGYITTPLANPDEQGFPRPEELEQLWFLEDSLTAMLCESDDIQYVGRCFTDGHLDMFFYIKDTKDWNKRVGILMSSFPQYTYNTGSHRDQEWEVYFDFLFPGPYDLICIQNRRALRNLEELGDDATTSRIVEHRADFPSPEAAEGFTAAVRELGFCVANPSHMADAAMAAGLSGKDTPQPSSNGHIILSLTRPDVPVTIDTVTVALWDLCLSHNGVYHGWSCSAQPNNSNAGSRNGPARA